MLNGKDFDAKILVCDDYEYVKNVHTTLVK
jgi:hypothetical protein